MAAVRQDRTGAARITGAFAAWALAFASPPASGQSAHAAVLQAPDAHPAAQTDTSEATTQRMIVREGEISVGGRVTPVFKVELDGGGRVVRARQGERLRVELLNGTTLPISVHPHGLVLPNSQDGVPFVTQRPVPPGATFIYDFVPKQSGSYFFHSHYGWQLQDQLVLPIVIDPAIAGDAPRDAAGDKARDAAGDRARAPEPTRFATDVVMMLTDLTFRNPPEIFAELRAKSMAPMQPMEPMAPMPGMEPGAKAAADLNDVDYDALLANGRPIEDAEVVRVEAGTRIRVRLINGSSATNFAVRFAGHSATLVAVDGEAVQPITIEAAEVAIAQRMDVEILMPPGQSTVPILAQGEGSTLLAALVLATMDAEIPSLPPRAAVASGAIGVGYRQERSLRPVRRLEPRPVDRSIPVVLNGRMSGYAWDLNGEPWPGGPLFTVREGERVELTFTNRTMMSHPMHLHGHVFQVTEIDGEKIDGAMRDTILVMPNSTVKVQFDADNPGLWMMHCHILWHEAAGMMGIVVYERYPKPSWFLERDTFDLPSSLPRK